MPTVTLKKPPKKTKKQEQEDRAIAARVAELRAAVVEPLCDACGDAKVLPLTAAGHKGPCRPCPYCTDSDGSLAGVEPDGPADERQRAKGPAAAREDVIELDHAASSCAKE